VSERDIENARRSYAAMNQAYRSGDPADYRPILEELFDPEVVFTPAGILPESSAAKARLCGSTCIPPKQRR
jgi:hypothetical protein